MIPPPEITSAGSFNVSVTLTEPPYLPHDDNWIYKDRYKMMIIKKNKGQSEIVKSFEFTDLFPKTSVASGLEPNTDYCIFIEYCGQMENAVQHNLQSSCKTVRTEESGKAKLYIKLSNISSP